MKILILPLLLVCSITCFSQKKDKRDGVYSAHLYFVEVPKNMVLGIVDTTYSTYEDSIIKIDWGYADSQIGFELTNKSEQTLKIVWDEAAFISLNNVSGRIFHKGIKYIDRENSQPPTSVYKNTTVSDLIAPTSYTYFSEGQYGGWRSRSLIPFMPSILSKKVEYDENLIGQTMRVVLPIKIDEQVIEYVFSFRTEFIHYKK